MRKRRKHRRPRALPPETTTGHENLVGMEVIEYVVGSWCSSVDGSGKPTAVALQLKIRGLPDQFLRLKSPAAVDEMIAALRRHQADVWPEYVS